MRWWPLVFVFACQPAPPAAPSPPALEASGGGFETMAPLGASTTHLPVREVLARPRGAGTAIAQLEGERTTWVTDGHHRDVDPVWLPADGDRPARIIFSSDRAGSFDLWSVAPDGSELTRLTFDDERDERHPDVSPLRYELVYRRTNCPERRLMRHRRVVFEACSSNACQVKTMTDRGWLASSIDSDIVQGCRRPSFAASGEELLVQCGRHTRLVTFATWRHGMGEMGDGEPAELPARPADRFLRQHIVTWDKASTLVADYGDVEAARISPNGVWLLATRRDADGPSLWLLRRDLSVRHRLTKGGGPTNARWIDERTIAFDAGGRRHAAEVSIAGAEVANLWMHPRLWRAPVDSPLFRHGVAVFDGRGHGYGPWPETDERVGFPSFARRVPLISADAILDLMSQLFSQAIIALEQHGLQPTLRAVTKTMATRARRAGHKRLATYFSVAAALAEREELGPTPSDTHEVAETLATLRDGVSGKVPAELVHVGSPRYDPSRFIVRGHYDRAGMRGFFRAMVWLSTVPVSVHDSVATSELGWPALARGITQAWEKITGPPATPSPAKVAAAVATHRDHETAMGALLGQMTIDARAVDLVVLPAGATPDAKWLSRLGPPPSPLEVMAHLGAARALELGQAPVPVWSGGATLHGQWLTALKGLLAPLPDGSWPAYGRSGAYRDKLLSTASSGYTQLLHHTILSRDPPRVRMGGTLLSRARIIERRVELPPQIQVEPVPHFFAALAELSDGLVDLVAASVAMSSAAGRDDLIDLKQRLGETKREVILPLIDALDHSRRGERYEATLEAQLAWIVDHAERRFKSVDGEGGLLGGQNPAPTCVIVDWFDMPQKRQLRALAVGHPSPFAVLVDHDGRRYVATAGATTFYVEDRGQGDRPTDRAWCQRLNTDGPPPTPPWTRSFRDTTKLSF